MNKILIPLAPGFEEIEAVTLIDILRRAEIEVTTAGLTPGAVTGSHHITIMPDILLSKINKGDYDMLLLPGGQPGTDNLKKNNLLIELIRYFQKCGKTIAAICAAPSVLAAAGVLNGKNVTSFPEYADKLGEVRYSEDRVVIDGSVMTSRGAGTAAEFAFSIIEYFKDKASAEKIKKVMLYK